MSTAGPFSVTLLADLAAKGFLVLGAAFVMDLLLRRRPARVRHLVWVVALSALLILPPLSLLIPKVSVPFLETPVVDATWVSPAVEPGLSPGAFPEAPSGEITPSNADAGVATSPATSGPLASVSLPRERSGSPVRLPLLLGIYLLGIVVVGAWQLVGRWYAWRVRHSCTPCQRPGATTLRDSLRRRLGLPRSVRLLQSQLIHVPMTTGLLRSVVVLPESAADWSERLFRSVLLHELAHVKRLDLWWRAVAQLACCLNWFNPLVWYGKRRMLTEQELACDNLVVAGGQKPSRYATDLLAIADTNAGRLEAFAARLGSKEELKQRLFELLQPRRNRRGITRSHGYLMLLGAALLLLSITAFDPWRSEPQAGVIDPARGNFVVLDPLNFAAMPGSSVQAESTEIDPRDQVLARLVVNHPNVFDQLILDLQTTERQLVAASVAPPPVAEPEEVPAPWEACQEMDKETFFAHLYERLETEEPMSRPEFKAYGKKLEILKRKGLIPQRKLEHTLAKIIRFLAETGEPTTGEPPSVGMEVSGPD